MLAIDDRLKFIEYRLSSVRNDREVAKYDDVQYIRFYNGRYFGKCLPTLVCELAGRPHRFFVCAGQSFTAGPYRVGGESMSFNGPLFVWSIPLGRVVFSTL